MPEAAAAPRRSPRDVLRAAWSGDRAGYAARFFVGQLVYAALGFGASVAIARLLGADGKGSITFWTLIAAAAGLVAAGNIPVGLGRKLLAGERGQIWATVTRHGVASAVAAVPLSVLLVVVGVDAVPALLFVGLAVPASAVTWNCLSVLQAGKRSVAYQSSRISSVATFGVGLGLALILGGGISLNLAFVVWTLGTLVGSVVALLAVRRLTGAASYAKGSMSSTNEAGAGSMFLRVGDWLLLRADQLILGAIAGPSSLGVYSVGVNWSEIGLYASHAAGEALFEDDQTLHASAVSRVLRRVTLLSIVASAIVAATGVLLIVPFFGPDFTSSVPVLIALAPGVAARGPGYASLQLIMARGRSPDVRHVFYWVLGLGLPAWVLASALAGPTAVAATTSVTYGLSAVLARRALRRTLELDGQLDANMDSP